jgi:hypothetical protein
VDIMDCITTKNKKSNTIKLIHSKISKWGIIDASQRLGLSIDKFVGFGVFNYRFDTFLNYTDLLYLSLYVIEKNGPVSKVNDTYDFMWWGGNSRMYFDCEDLINNNNMTGYGTPYYDDIPYLEIENEYYRSEFFNKYSIDFRRTYKLKSISEFKSFNEFESYILNDVSKLVSNTIFDVIERAGRETKEV